MIVNYLFEDYDWGWTGPYNEMVAWALAGLEVNYLDVTGMGQHEVSEVIRTAPKCDVWYCFSALDIWLKGVKGRSDKDGGTPIIVHNHGGMETLDIISLVRGPADTTVLPLLVDDPRVRILFNTIGNMEDFREFYGGDGSNFRVVGYPIEQRSGNEHRSDILVPGRFSATKQTMLAAAILYHFRSFVTFCTPLKDRCDYWFALKAMGYDVVSARGDEYEKLIASYKVGFSASMSDSMNASVAEMAATGARMVVPDRTPFNDPGYIDPTYRYAPFDINDARAKLHLAWTHADSSWPDRQVSRFDPKAVAKRVWDVLGEVCDVPTD